MTFLRDHQDLISNNLSIFSHIFSKWVPLQKILLHPGQIEKCFCVLAIYSGTFDCTRSGDINFSFRLQIRQRVPTWFVSTFNLQYSITSINWIVGSLFRISKMRFLRLVSCARAVFRVRIRRSFSLIASARNARLSVSRK